MPYCPKCEKEVPADAKFCANCGAVLQTTAQAAPTPTSAYTPPNPLGDLGSRIVAGIVDYVIIGIVTGILALLLFLPAWLVTGRWFSGFFGVLGVMWLLWLIYFTYFEGTSGQTIGKKLAHIKVIKEDGSKCDFGSALVRNILRIVDHLPFLYILGIILIAATDKRQRLGDMLGKTSKPDPTALRSGRVGYLSCLCAPVYFQTVVSNDYEIPIVTPHIRHEPLAKNIQRQQPLLTRRAISRVLV